MQANIFIQDVIGEDTTLKSVRADYERYDASKVNDVLVTIDSVGGLTDQGYAIYDYLKSLNKPITTKILGRCYSIATVVALAGDKRVMTPNSKIMIHNPWLELRTGADAKLLKNLSENLQEEEDKLSKFYANKLGKPESEIENLMDAETYFNPTKAKELGFITEEVQELKAVAQLNENKYTMSTEKVEITAEKKDLLAEVKETLMSLVKSVKAEEHEEMKEEAMQDGEEKAEEDDKMKMMEEAIESLKAELASMKEEKTAIEAEKAEADKAVQAKAKETDSIKAQLEALNSKLSTLGIGEDAPTKEKNIETPNAKQTEDAKGQEQLKAYKEMQARKHGEFKPLIKR